MHILWECPSSVDMWGACARSIQKSVGSYTSFLEVVDAMITRCSKEELNIFALTTKKIWAKRNDVVHGGDFQHPNRIVIEARELLQQFSVELGGNSAIVAPQMAVNPLLRWHPPPFGRYKLNWDVA